MEKLRMSIPYTREELQLVLSNCVKASGLREAYVEMIVKRLDLILPQQPQARFGIRQRHRSPIPDRTVLDGRDCFEGGMFGVEQSLCGGQAVAFGSKRLGRLGFLLGRQRFANTEPRETQTHCRRARA